MTTRAPDKKAAERYRQYLLTEWEAAALYRKLAAAEGDTDAMAALEDVAHQVKVLLFGSLRHFGIPWSDEFSARRGATGRSTTRSRIPDRAVIRSIPRSPWPKCWALH